MKYLLLVILLLAVLYMISCDLKKNELSALPDDAYLVDVRTTKEFEGGSVPNAINIPLDQVAASIDKFKNKENIVVFCRSGNRSGKAKKILEANGIGNVTNGGSWKSVLELTQ